MLLPSSIFASPVIDVATEIVDAAPPVAEIVFTVCSEAPAPEDIPFSAEPSGVAAAASTEPGAPSAESSSSDDEKSEVKSKVKPEILVGYTCSDSGCHY